MSASIVLISTHHLHCSKMHFKWWSSGYNYIHVQQIYGLITQTYVHPIDASHSNCEVTMCGKCTAQQSYMCKISEFSEESCRQRMNVVHIIFLPGG